MTKLPFRWMTFAWCAAATLWIQGSAWAANRITWDPQVRRMDADVEQADLSSVLRQLSEKTGWLVFVEPNTQHDVSVRFSGLPAGEALKRMLGSLSFALLPRTNAAPKLFVYRTSLQEATQLVADEQNESATRKGAIPNELVLTLRAGSKNGIEALAKRLGAKILGRVDGLNTYRLQFQDQAAAEAARAALEGNPDVAATDSNYPVERPTRVDPLDSSSGPGFSLKPKLGNSGGQTIVALIDTPVQPLDPKMAEFFLPAIHVAGEPTLNKEELTHGTSMAETLLHGIALGPQESGGSSVRILPVDVYGNSPDTTTFDVAKGIYAALAAGASVVNLSLGGAGDSEFLGGLIHAAHQQGVMFFGAAGNQPTTDLTFPAAYPDVVAVTAGDKKGNVAAYANRGDFIDAIAPGVSLVQYGGQSYLVRGTSAATAYLSGTAAGYRASGSTPPAVEAYIRQAFSPGALPRP